MSEMIERSLRKARKLEASRDLIGALNILEGLVQKFPKNSRAVARRDETKINLLRRQVGVSPPDDVQTKLRDLYNSSNWLQLEYATTKLMELHPKSAFLLNMFGMASRELGNAEVAERAHRKALSINPQLAATYINLGNAIQELGKLEEALECYQTGLLKDPTIATAYNNLANCLGFFGKHDESERNYKTALEIDPDYSDAKYNLGGVKLLKGEFEEGWNLREFRWTRPDFKPHLERFSSQQWNGEPADKLFVWAEQGIGDEVMFGSCLDEIRHKAKKLFVSVDKRSITLFERSFPGINFVDRKEKISQFDFDEHVSAMTALGFCRRNIEDFGNTEPGYIKPCPNKVSEIRSELERLAEGRPIVGVSWFSKAKLRGKSRSVSLIDLIKYLPKDAFLVNLQYGDVSADTKKLKAYLGKELHFQKSIDNSIDIDGFCALIKACDRVVSIDNSTVHFAGSINVRCDVILPIGADWRWGDNAKDKSYWYPSLTLHRQDKLDDWSAALISLRSTFSSFENQ